MAEDPLFNEARGDQGRLELSDINNIDELLVLVVHSVEAREVGVVPTLCPTQPNVVHAPLQVLRSVPTAE